MNVQFLGHSAFLVELKGKTLLFDPFLSGNPLAQHIDIEGIHADYILLTHGHQDHVLDAEAIAKRCNATIISNFEIVTWYGEKGIQGHGMNIGGKYTFDFGTVKYVNAIHSSVLPDGTHGGNPGGFVIWNDEVSFYIAGDTALCEDMKLIPRTCPALDFAIFPIGDNFTMGYEDAVIASEFVQCNTVIGCHYNTFPPIAIDGDKAREAFAARSTKLLLPAVGESVEL